MFTTTLTIETRNVSDGASRVHDQRKLLRRRPNGKTRRVVSIREEVVVEPHASAGRARELRAEQSPAVMISLARARRRRSRRRRSRSCRSSRRRSSRRRRKKEKKEEEGEGGDGVSRRGPEVDLHQWGEDVHCLLPAALPRHLARSQEAPRASQGQGLYAEGGVDTGLEV